MLTKTGNAYLTRQRSRAWSIIPLSPTPMCHISIQKSQHNHPCKKLPNKMWGACLKGLLTRLHLEEMYSLNPSHKPASSSTELRCLVSQSMVLSFHKQPRPADAANQESKPGLPGDSDLPSNQVLNQGQYWPTVICLNSQLWVHLPILYLDCYDT